MQSKSKEIKVVKSMSRDGFRRQQDIEREKYREELSNGKSIKHGLAWGLYLGVSLIIGLVAVEYYTRDWVLP